MSEGGISREGERVGEMERVRVMEVWREGWGERNEGREREGERERHTEGEREVERGRHTGVERRVERGRHTGVEL